MHQRRGCGDECKYDQIRTCEPFFFASFFFFRAFFSLPALCVLTVFRSVENSHWSQNTPIYVKIPLDSFSGSNLTKGTW